MDEKLKLGLKKLWEAYSWLVINGLGVIAVLICIASIVGYSKLNPISNPVIFVFGYAVWWFMTRLGSKLNPVLKTAKSGLWYWGVFIGGWLVINMYFSHVLNAMYIAWADYDRSFWGFTQCFAPVILVLVSAIWVCAISTTPRTFSRRFLITAGILGAMGFFGFELLGPGQEYIAAKKIAAAQALAGNSLNSSKEDKRVAEVTVKNAKAYRFDPSGRYFDQIEKLVFDAGFQFPLYKGTKETEEDGPHKLIRVFLPDENKEFSRRSPTAYVRTDEIKIVRIAQKQNGVSIKKSDDGKTWWITFNTDGPVMITELKIGQKYIISGAPHGQLKWPDINGSDRFFSVPQGTEITNKTMASLTLKAEPGIQAEILFIKGG